MITPTGSRLMGPPVKRCSSRGLLLVEAVLSAVVIATGLVLISRGLSGQLKALRATEAYDALLSLASGKLLELEGDRLARASHGAPMEGAFPDPYADFHWALVAMPRDGPRDLKDKDRAPLTCDVALTVAQRNTSAASVTLRAIWPSAWVSQN